MRAGLRARPPAPSASGARPTARSRASCRSAARPRRSRSRSDGALLAIGDRGGLRLVPVAPNAGSTRTSAARAAITSIAFAPGGELFASGDAAGNLQLARVATGEAVGAARALASAVRWVGFGGDGVLLAVTDAWAHSFTIGAGGLEPRARAAAAVLARPRDRGRGRRTGARASRGFRRARHARLRGARPRRAARTLARRPRRRCSSAIGPPRSGCASTTRENRPLASP